MCQLPSVILEDEVASIALPSEAPGKPLALTLIRQEASPCPNTPAKFGTDETLIHNATVIAPTMLNGPSGMSTYPEVPSKRTEWLADPKKELVGPDLARVQPPI